jgi:3-dehydroquinate dehydratase/shikimate dehydrogenase
MTRVNVYKSSLSQSVTLPSSKSHTIRAILLAALAKGTSFIRHPLFSSDTPYAIQAAMQFGAKIEEISSGISIEGVAGFPSIPNDVINAGNSGQVLRFASAFAALSTGYTVITGDYSIRSNRPIQPLLHGLHGLNTWAVSTRNNGYPPLIVKGPLQAGKIRINGEDSQPVSALLMAAAFIEGITEIEVENAGEKPWLALTLSWLDRLHVSYTHTNLEHFIVHGKKERPAFDIAIPGDLSALAFPVIAALVTRSSVCIHRADMKDVQGDKALLAVLQKMGAHIDIDAAAQKIQVHVTDSLKGQVIDVNPFIDAVPILAVLGCCAKGETRLVNGANARKKECNRLQCMVTELRKMGAKIQETEDGLYIQPSLLEGALVESHADHRVAMSLIVAGLFANGKTVIEGVDCIEKSYPHFIRDLQKIGAKIDSATEEEFKYQNKS